jgi:hypothetical protein
MAAARYRMFQLIAVGSNSAAQESSVQEYAFAKLRHPRGHPEKENTRDSFSHKQGANLRFCLLASRSSY